MSNFNMFSKVFGDVSPDTVMKDVQHLRQKGCWQTGEVPIWAKIYQCEHDVSCITPGMLLFVYDWLLDYYCKKSEWQPVETIMKTPLPCPWCGNEPSIFNFSEEHIIDEPPHPEGQFFVQCVSPSPQCPVNPMLNFYYPTREAAIDAWNSYFRN